MRRLTLLFALCLAVAALVVSRHRAGPPSGPTTAQPAAQRESLSAEPVRSQSRGVDASKPGANPGANPSAGNDAQPKPLVRCFPGDVGGSPPRPIDALLDRAADLFDSSQYELSLACAEEAARVDGSSVEAHHDRADALRELKRLPEAEDAFARALALDPDDPKTLDGAADFYINRLTPTEDHLETGLALARRGAHKLKRSSDRALASHLSLLEGEALSDLGRSREAVAQLEAALALDPDNVHIVYERAVAEFELCRFEDARRDFEKVLAKDPKDSGAHHQLGLVLERLGDGARAERELSQARVLSPADYKEPVLPAPAEFRALVDAEVAKLPEALRRDLSQCTLETADLPELTDLVAEEPPLSPTILGLFRGAPLDDPTADPAEGRAIVIYRKNLGRAVQSRDELIAQIRTTLLHELGHLRGEDDSDLRARGLE